MSLLRKLFKSDVLNSCRRCYSKCGVKKGLVLGVYSSKEQPNRLTGIAKKFDEKNGSVLCQHLESLNEPLGLGETSYLTNIDPAFFNVCLVGAGCGKSGFNKLEELDECKESARVAAAAGTRVLRDTGVELISVDPMMDVGGAAEGAELAVWQYNEFCSDGRKSPKIELFESEAKDEWQKGIIRASCQNVARELSESPGNCMTPMIFAQTAADILCQYGIEMEIRDRDWIESQKLNAFLAVGRGSCEPPALVEITYNGGACGDSPVLLIGKGTTFNTGGISLWNPEDMHEMRGDMSGAAVIVAVIKAAAMLSLNLNIRGLIPLCENMPSGMALKPGDVVQSLAGKRILVEDTGREGVLMLADALTYGQRTYKPKLILDVATLTTGARDCMGSGATAVFTKDEDLWVELAKAGSISGDRLWRLPLWKHFTEKVTREATTDLSNVGLGQGGSPCLAAAFLNEFVESEDWAHLDTFGTGMMSAGEEIPYLEQGRMTGRPTRTIYQLLHQITPGDSCAGQEVS